MKDNSFIVDTENLAPLEIIGLKAYNLQTYRIYTPYYLICSSVLYSNWLEFGDNYLKQVNHEFTKIIQIFQKKGSQKIIIRSSCTNESILDRGKYISKTCIPNVKNLKDEIVEIFKDFKSITDKTEGSLIALIIQDFKYPKMQGHLSNERRVSRDKEHWLIEKENVKEKFIKVEFIDVEPSVKELDHSIVKCLNVKSLTDSLKTTVSSFSKLENRYHLEWLWDGKNYWIVQIDTEYPIKKGSKPGSEWLKQQNKFREKFSLENGQEKKLEVFETVDSTITDWHKIDCLKTFNKCNLLFWNIYILENDYILDKLKRKEVDISLKSDLKWLMTSPITIRTDKLSNTEVMLPRSDTIFDYKQAEEFLINTTKKLTRKGLKTSEFCFLIHRFIISKAGVLSFAKPNLDRVRIDSTWGIVEGLYYHPHDSFEVILSDKKIKKKIRCKSKYIDVNKKGDWYSKETGSNLDWKQTITDKQIFAISRQSQQIADYLDRPVTIMYFVNENNNTYPEILPWYYSIDEIPEKDTLHTEYTKAIFSEKKELIRSKEDFVNLKNKQNKKVNIIKNKIHLNINADIIRDKKFIEEIAEFALIKGFVVQIEGSILSHAYYVLSSKGVDVRCMDPLELSYGHKEFYKLVRDKIPIKIEENNETVVSTKVSSTELINFLKEKIVEEAFEMYWSKNNDNLIEEAADVLEVLRGTCKAFGIDFKEIESIANNKKEKRGGFDEGVVLVASKENSLFQVLGKNKELFNSINESSINVKLKPLIKFFQKGEITNFKSLTEVTQFNVPYINNYSSKSNSYRYLLKNQKYNSICIIHKEKELLIQLEKLNNIESSDPSQLSLF